MATVRGIFAETAPKYWAKGLPAIPLAPKTKKPVSESWQTYAHQMPDEETQALWLGKYANGNVGLPMGEQSGLVAIDVDTDDPKVTEIIRTTLKATPWVRRGKKGAVYIYRWNRHKTFRIRTLKGESILEMLSSGTQIVLPPSIHPDTQMPYTANCELLDVLGSVPDLPVDIESRLRAALSQAGYDLSTKGYTKYTEVVSVGSRDSKMTSMAGLMAKGVTRGERTLLEAVSEMQSWVENFTEVVAGDSMDTTKAVAKLIEFIQRDLEQGGRALPETWAKGLSLEEKTRFAAAFGEENEAWGLQRILDFVQEGFETSQHTEDRMVAVETAMKKAATNDRLTPMDHDVLVEFIANASGKTITRAGLRRRLIELQKGPIPGENHSEIAELLIAELSRTGEVRYYNGRFLQWKGCHWQQIDKSMLMTIISKEYGSLPAGRRQSDHEGVFKILMNLVSRGFDRMQTRGINFANGFLTTDLRLLDHDPEFGSTYVMPYCYDVDKAKEGGEHCQRFLSFLYQCWGHNPDFPERVEALRQSLGATLFGIAPLYQRAFCLIGVPHSGKSVLMSIIQNMLPEGSFSHVPPSSWGDKFMPTMMDGKLANFCGELSESDTIPGDVFKSVIDGEQMTGQFKGRDIFFFKPMCAHWFASNHLPRTRDSSAGFTRRWLFLHFDRAVPEQDRVVGLANEITAEEQAAIVAWAVESVPGMMAENALLVPPSHRKLLQEMAGMNNSVRHFLTVGPLLFGIPVEPVLKRLPSGKLMPDPDLAPELAIPEPPQEFDQDLHAEYNIFCRENGARPVSLAVFRQRMMEMQTEFAIEVGPSHVIGLRIAARDAKGKLIAPS